MTWVDKKVRENILIKFSSVSEIEHKEQEYILHTESNGKRWHAQEAKLQIINYFFYAS